MSFFSSGRFFDTTGAPPPAPGPQPGDTVLVTCGASGNASPVPFATLDYDEIVGAWNGAADTLLTVPTGITLARHSFGMFNSDDPGGWNAEHNAASTKAGLAKSVTSGGLSFWGQNAVSAPLEVTGGDTFRLARIDGTYGTGGQDWQMLEVLDPAMDRCLVTKSAQQAFVSAGAWETLTWDEEQYDTGGFHDNVTNNSRLTIPADGIYRITFGAQGYSLSNRFRARAIKNGSPVAGLPHVANNYRISGVSVVSAISAPMALVAGDYIEMQAYVDTLAGGIDNVDAFTWFAIERLADDHAYCLITKTNAQNVTTGNPEITFDTDVHDPLGMFSPTASRIIVPSGYRFARGIGCLGTGSAPNKQEMVIGQTVNNVGHAVYTGQFSLAAATAWMQSDAAREFAMNCYSSSTSAVAVDGIQSWFCVELKV